MRCLCTLSVAVAPLLTAAVTAPPLAAQLAVDDPWAGLRGDASAAHEPALPTRVQQTDERGHADRATGAALVGFIGSLAGTFVGALSALDSDAGAVGRIYILGIVGATTGAGLVNGDHSRSFEASLWGAGLGTVVVWALGGAGRGSQLLFPVVQGLTTGILGTPR